MTLIWILVFLVAMTALAYHRASLPVWTIAFFVLMALVVGVAHPGGFALSLMILLYLFIFGVLNIHPLRRFLVSNRVLKIYRGLMPKLSDTEQAALESGTVGWEGDLFSGMPDWEKLQKLSLSTLSEEEQAFLEGPVEDVCRMIDSWVIAKTMKIPDNIWEKLKSDGFFGMIIPKKYGGKEFSAFGHAQVIFKLGSISTAVATVASVPNSLGPAELILTYGTEEQKAYYLPRLASGEDIPCFALTSPVAGSDAGSITDTGVICRETFEGKEQLCLRLNWNKRYITLSPIATLLGLAFKCFDPDHLIGDQEKLGITCALVPMDLPGVTRGRRHFPLHSAFPNGPTQGKDVIIPLDSVIGGQKMIGQGWRMLIECLAVGRAITLPAMTGSNAKRAVLASGAYTRIRRQFNTALSGFEGVQEALARMAGHTYAVEALRTLTLAYLDLGETPAVASAISKYHATELSRTVIIDAMDVHGGKGICMGPNNYLAQCFIESPIGITVEGANILTRSMMIYGQGAIRCHPYLLTEIKAANEENNHHGEVAFDRALFGHIGFMMSNKARSFCLGVSQGRGTYAPNSPLKTYYQLFTRFSAALAFISDAMTLLIGAELKRREMLSARLGDVLSLLYIGSAVLRFYEEKDLEEELPLAKWACKDLLYRIQAQLEGLIANVPCAYFRFALRLVIFPRGKNLKPPCDALTREVAALITAPSKTRMRFAEGIYYTPHSNNPVAEMEAVLAEAVALEPIQTKILKAERKGQVSGCHFAEVVASAIEVKVITQSEGEQLLSFHEKRIKIINVDDFSEDEM